MSKPSKVRQTRHRYVLPSWIINNVGPIAARFSISDSTKDHANDPIGDSRPPAGEGLGMSNEMDAMAGGPGSDAIKGTENAPAQQKAEEKTGAAATEAVADQNPAQPAPRKQLKSKKLDRTLEELESAFTNWESLNDTKAHAAEVKEDQRKAKDPSVAEEEFRKRTRMLLHQLRQQLADFSND